MLSRRALLGGLASLPFASAGLLSAAPERVLFLSAFTDDHGANRAVIFDETGRLQAQVDLPARGHGGAFSPASADVTCFARRPGRYAIVFDRHSGRLLGRLASPDGRHFFGHGIYSPDGKLLLTTENAYESGDGMIGVWDTSGGYRRLGEFPSFGIDPHDIRFMPGGRIIAVANGGIMTHPDLGRQKLNLAEMASSLVLIDSRSGQLVEKITLPAELKKLSIRHMAVNGDGAIGIAMQYEGASGDRPPLVFIWRGKGDPQLLSMPANLQDRSENYCGSAALDLSGRVLAVSSPRGNFATFWSMADGTHLDTASLSDTCGIAGIGDGRFLLSSGDGQRLLHQIRAADGALPTVGGKDMVLPAASGHWDNHIIRSI